METSSSLRRLAKPLIVALWAAFLFLPFKGLQSSLILFMVCFASLSLGTAILPWLKALFGRLGDAGRSVRQSVFLRHSRVAGVAVAFFLLCLPFFMQNYLLDITILTGIYAILAIGLNIIVGFTGLLNLGFVAFYAIGAYAYALLNLKLGLGFWQALPLCLALTSLSGFLLAVPALRLRGDYLAIVTLGFGEIVRLVLNNWDSLTNGPNGLSGIAPPVLFGRQLSALDRYYYVVLFAVAVTSVVVRRIRASKLGRAWIALREDEVAASAMGISPTRFKAYAMGFGAFWAGLAGTLFAAKMQFVSPESFTFTESVLILCMVILGGLGSITGVVIGAVILVLLPEALREVQMYRMLILSSGLIFMMIVAPRGLAGILRRNGP